MTSEVGAEASVQAVRHPGVTEPVMGGAVSGVTLQQPRIEHAGRGGGGALVPVRSTEQARELARRRWDAVSAAARRGLVKAGEQLPDVRASSPVAVVEYLVSQHALNAADPSARGSQASFKQVMDLAYPKPEREVSSGPASPATGASLAELDGAALDALMAALRARVAGEGGG